MANKKTVTTTEEVIEETPEQEVNYTEDIKGKTMTEVSAEVKEEPKEEVKEEVVTEEVKVEDPKPTEFDAEQFKKDTTQAVKEELADFLKGTTDKETEENVDAYAKFAKDTWEKDGRNPTYAEALKFVKDQAISEIKAEQEAAVKAQEDQQAAIQKDRDAYLESFNKKIDEELDELYRSNKLPKVKNAEDPTDEGIVARKALFQTMADVNIKRVEEGQPPIDSLTRIYTNFHKPPVRQPAGADAPIFDSNGAATSVNDEEEIDYIRDIRGGFKKLYNNVVKR